MEYNYNDIETVITKDLPTLHYYKGKLITGKSYCADGIKCYISGIIVTEQVYKLFILKLTLGNDCDITTILYDILPKCTTLVELKGATYMYRGGLLYRNRADYCLSILKELGLL